MRVWRSHFTVSLTFLVHPNAASILDIWIYISVQYPIRIFYLSQVSSRFPRYDTSLAAVESPSITGAWPQQTNSILLPQISSIFNNHMPTYHQCGAYISVTNPPHAVQRGIRSKPNLVMSIPRILQTITCHNRVMFPRSACRLGILCTVGPPAGVKARGSITLACILLPSLKLNRRTFRTRIFSGQLHIDISRILKMKATARLLAYVFTISIGGAVVGIDLGKSVLSEGTPTTTYSSRPHRNDPRSNSLQLLYVPTRNCQCQQSNRSNRVHGLSRERHRQSHQRTSLRKARS